MEEIQEKNIDPKSVPILYSFITLRREFFGGILFNPFLPAEIALDEQEYLIAWMCSGEYTVEEICTRCLDIFGGSPDEGTEIMKVFLNVLEKASAVRFTDKKLQYSSHMVIQPGIPGEAFLSAPKTVIWDVTYACNLECLHCLTDSGKKWRKELNTSEAFRLIDSLAAAKVLYLALSGGEPFVRHDILELISHVAKTGMRVDIATNGFRIPDIIFEGLRDLPVFHIQVSIDGIGDRHNNFRGNASAFEESCKSIKRFREEGLTTSMSMTVTPKNIDQVGDVIDLAVRLGCVAVKAIPFIPAGRGRRNNHELMLDKQMALRFNRSILEKSSEYGEKIRIYTESTFLFLLDNPTVTTPGDERMLCSAANDVLSIGADGTVYPCPFLHDFPMGNLMSDTLQDIWFTSDVLNDLRMLEKNRMNGSCRACTYATEFCRGGCRASSYLINGDIRGSDPLCFKELVAGE